MPIRRPFPICFKLKGIFRWIPLFLLWNGLLSAQTVSEPDSADVYIVENNYPLQSLLDYTKIWIDASGKTTIDEILNLSPEITFHDLDETFKQNKHNIPNFPESLIKIDAKASAWIKLSLKAKVDIENWWLIFTTGEKDPVRYITRHEHVDVYFTRSNQVFHHTKTGFLDKAAEKDIPKHTTISRTFTGLKKGEHAVIYWKIQDANVLPTIELRNPEFPLPNPLVGIYNGIIIISLFCLIIGIYVLFFYFFTFDRSYLYFFGMLLCMYLHFQILHPYVVLIDWFFSKAPYLVNAAWVITTRGTYICMIQFGRSFTNLPQLNPIWDKVFNRIGWGIFIFMMIEVILILTGHPLPGRLSEILTGAFFILTLGVIIRLAFIKDILIRYFVFGAGWLVFFAVLGILWNMNIIPFFSNPNPWIISQAGFIIIYALGLTHKIQISERAKVEVEKFKEIDAVKTRFFANISHEFRTPLTLILAPLNKLQEGKVRDPHRYYKTMNRNANRLLQLINQLLDLSKLDAGKMELKVTKTNVNTFLKAMVYSFESWAERKKIHFQTQFPNEDIFAFLDKDKVEKIVVNLLSNAFKFTPEKGIISVEVNIKTNYLRIFVEDSGKGISKDELNKIFDRFHQTTSNKDSGMVGSGIGLALVKELTELHKGQISVSSKTGSGTRIKVSLPIDKNYYSKSEIISYEPQKTKFNSFSNDAFYFEEKKSDHPQNGSIKQHHAPLLLVVEDNVDLRKFIVETLGNTFQVIEAKDGQEGFEKALDTIPDLVVSDVMMPNMDGNEMCKQMKTNEKTSHIPVILLTAKAEIESKIEGLETGADDYLTKPFDEKELLVRINNLIEQRRKLRARFSKEIKLIPKEIAIVSADEIFLNKVLTAIEDNMGDERFSVEVLSKLVSMSRSQLNRKLSALCSQSPSLIIRKMRLQRGKDLLENGAGNISEIAYEVGFSSPAYFAKCFNDQFGVAPSSIKPN